jgi:predicted ATPase
LICIDLNSSQREGLHEFGRVCNDYLTGKEMIYDNVSYHIFIRQTDVQSAGPAEEGEQLELKSLSSGEKQIVSLISHIYLFGKQCFVVIIDEPELSLSVPWQRKLLPDILATGECNGLIAVTHSPFIWENELEPYVHPLTEFASVTNVIR